MHKLLIANRGEIAVRIASTASCWGIRTVAVHSSADDDAPHVRACDEAVRVGGPAPAESYLRGDALIEAARRTGADAVHPGYGFLSENAAFAQAVIDAGLTWVGPPPRVIATMGSKSAARELAVSLEVPVLPGSTDVTLAAAEAIGWPVLVKAVAGGGGRGMRVVEGPDTFEAACQTASREATAAFGDGTLMLEKYLQRPRHVEIQVFSDTHGGHVHLAERECSIQRRHQKVIEEHPSVALDDHLRARMGAAAVKLAEGIGYVGAGTVEFLVDEHGGFYFLEMNTRLQVEHRVTEGAYGFIDLVEWQLRVARGEPLPELPERRFASIEARLYAEDPDEGYAPRTGTVVDLHLPHTLGVRMDTGVEVGSVVSTHYDPMLAKVISFGQDRDEARLRLIRGLEDLSVLGVGTNVDHLLRVLRHPAYAAGDQHTGFLDVHAAELAPADTSERDLWALLAVAAVTLAEPRAVLPGVERGWRNSRWRDPSLHLGGGEVRWRRAGAGWRLTVGGTAHAVEVVTWDAPVLRLRVDGLSRSLRLARTGDTWWAHGLGGIATVSIDDPWPAPEVETAGDACVAPMPGKVLQVAVEAGQAVTEGQLLAILEAMKTEHRLLAPRDGVVAAVQAREGDQVDAGAVLVALADEE